MCMEEKLEKLIEIVEFIVDVDSNKNLMVEINTSKSNIRFNY